MIENEDSLLRLLFSNEHYFNNDIQDLAISLDDLKSRGFSLDLEKICDLNVIEERIKSQAEKASDENARREAFISSLINGVVTSLLDQDGDVLFETFHSPIAENFAHTSLICKKKEKTRSHYVWARNKLKPLLTEKIVKISDFKLDR
ncbi:hypothetical protein [Serratia sp. 22264]|uniref:hypothetical protein n=1 Tax=Serratia sp. 22264 TaxID=3453897 RepID=UPI003F846927